MGHTVRPDGTINTGTSQHTPGPWEVSKIGNNYDQHSIYAGDAIVANSVEGEANARLIAAAPKLKELLDDIAKDLADYQNEIGIGTMDDKQWAQLFIDRVTATITNYETNEMP